MSEPLMKIEVAWKREAGRGESCFTCGDHMYASTYRFTVEVDERTINTDIVICNPCYDALKDKDAVS